MSTTIAVLSENLSNWSIVATCRVKYPIVSHLDAGNKPATSFDFELVDHSHRIRVTAVNDIAHQVYNVVRVGAHYKVDSRRASLRQVQRWVHSEIRCFMEIELTSPDAIRKVIGDAQAVPHAPRNSDSRPVSPPRSSISASSKIASHSSLAQCLSVSSFSNFPKSPSFRPSHEYNISGGVTAIRSGTDSNLARTNVYEITLKDAITADGIFVLVCTSHRQVKRLVESGQLQHSQIEIRGARFKNVVHRRPTFSVAAGASIDITPQVGSLSRDSPLPSLPAIDRYNIPHIGLGTKQTAKISVDAFTNADRVFISHAGQDKQTIAMPLHERLKEVRISCFYDDESLRVGDSVPERLFKAMEMASIVVFVLSPEFVGRKWPMRELKFILDLKRERTAKGYAPPRIVPVFYRWEVEDCKTEKFVFERRSDLMRAGLFEEKRQKEMSVEDTRKYLRELANITGVTHSRDHHENRDEAILDKTYKAVVENINLILEDVQLRGGRNSA